MVMTKEMGQKSSLESPEKIYLQVCGECNANDCENCKFEDLEENITWCKDKIFKKDIEYTRTDAFIEKAVNFLEMLGCGFTITDHITHTNYGKEQLIKDFRNYMKGE